MRLRLGIVLRVGESACEVQTEAGAVSVQFASQFPRPRVERVSPGHLVALAKGATGDEIVVWRWYDAVVLGVDEGGLVLLWEPAHGELLAKRRKPHQQYDPGSRAYSSAGLPGSEWWVAGRVVELPQEADVELAAVEQLYTDSGLWAGAFEQLA